jgi:hypothetical protein
MHARKQGHEKDERELDLDWSVWDRHSIGSLSDCVQIERDGPELVWVPDEAKRQRRRRDSKGASQSAWPLLSTFRPSSRTQSSLSSFSIEKITLTTFEIEDQLVPLCKKPIHRSTIIFLWEAVERSVYGGLGLITFDEDALDGILGRLVKLGAERWGNGEELGVVRVVEGNHGVIEWLVRRVRVETTVRRVKGCTAVGMRKCWRIDVHGCRIVVGNEGIFREAGRAADFESPDGQVTNDPGTDGQ